MVLRLLCLFICFHSIYSLYIIEHTLKEKQSLYRDCIRVSNDDKQLDDYLFYCLRIDDFSTNSWYNNCYTGDRITFKELQIKQINANELLQWQIPLDIADFYGMYLSTNSSTGDNHFICNCSSSNIFGRYCEYAFLDGIHTLEDLINAIAEEKKLYYPKDRLIPCYELETNHEHCLDYRDICDGEYDTINGEDEFYCNLIEINHCNENEFRCRNGLCIDRQFLFDGQADCTDLTDEQSILILKKYHNFENCYQKSTIDCDEHWCGRDMISCGDGQCIPWFKRFWNDYDCQNFYTHVYNCELEERNDLSIDFSITDNQGRCKTNITEFHTTDNNYDQCLLMIKCAITRHPSCKVINKYFSEYEEGIAHAYGLCQNYSLIDYASGRKFFSPFVRAYYIPDQFRLTVKLEFFALMRVRVPGKLCLIGERMCQGRKVIHNGSVCFSIDDIYEKNYPFPPYEYFFCQKVNLSIDSCMNTTLFYRCRTTGECISKHRLFDGFPDCLDRSDEDNLDILDSLDSSFMKDRYNCTIDGKKSSAVLRHFLGDGISQCMNGTDEMSLSINWQQQQCLKSNDSACLLLRNLYRENNEETSMEIIRFTSLCDSVWDLRNGSDEIDCQEWICDLDWIKQQNNFSRWSGNCINSSWLCNRIWDYPDGNDEFNCNYTEIYPIPHCLLLSSNLKEIILLNETNSIAGNGQIDCLGGIDERVTYACNDGFPLNERFLCHNTTICLQPMDLCNHVHDCPYGDDENEYWCGPRSSSNINVCEEKRFACQERNDSGPCIPQEDRCHDERASCLYSHRDEYMCIHPRKYNQIQIEKSSPPGMKDIDLNRISPWYCDRGLVFYRYGKLACLCPPSFFGNRCEKHSHRLTVVFTLNMTESKHMNLIRILVSLMNSNETIDYIILTQQTSYTAKHRLYLNYPRYLYSNLRSISNNYSVQFQVYRINNNNNNNVKLLCTSQYSIKYPFLPAFRLAVALKCQDGGLSNPIYQNITNNPCASNSQPLIVGKQHIVCICTSQQYGPTCHLTTKTCPIIYCQNQGTCRSYIDQYYNSIFECFCTNGYFGQFCQYKKASLSFDLHNQTNLHSTARVIQLINYDLTKMQLEIKERHLISKNPEPIYYNNDFASSSIGLLKVYERTDLNIYLLYIGQNYSNISLTEKHLTKCLHTKEFDLIPMNNSHDARLYIIKRYHRPCQKNTTVCFYDDNMYFCFCNSTTQRASCFRYDFTADNCNECLNGGRCVQGNRKRKTDNIACLCPACHYGTLCEFNAEPFGFTLDSLIFYDSFALQIVYLCLATILFIIGLVTNLCSLMTFYRSNSRKSGVCRYLFVAAILNQTALFFLVLKFLSILLGSIYIIAHIVSCKSIAYFLSVTTRANYWLTTWITIERLTIILFPSSTVFRNPRISIIMIIITILAVMGMHVHELFFYTVIDLSSLCIPIFQSSIITIYNQSNVIFHHLVPFLVQVIMITLLILLAARSRARSVGRTTNFRKVLKKQFHTHKELYLTPAIIVLIFSALPQAILSFSAACTELKVWQRYILLATYFLSYLPQMLGFILHVLPSSGYTSEFKETPLGKLRLFKWMLAPKQRQDQRTNAFNMTLISAEPKSPNEEQQPDSLLTPL